MARTGRPPKGTNYIARARLSFRLPRELVVAFKRVARRQKISQTDYAERALRLLLEEGDLAPKNSIPASQARGRYPA